MINMNKEEIHAYLKRTDLLLDKLTGDDKDTLEWLIFGYNACAKLLNESESIITKAKEAIELDLSFATLKMETNPDSIKSINDLIKYDENLLKILDGKSD